MTEQGGRESPVLIISWIHGLPSAPTDWFAEIIRESPNQEGAAIVTVTQSGAEEVHYAARNELTPIG